MKRSLPINILLFFGMLGCLFYPSTAKLSIRLCGNNGDCPSSVYAGCKTFCEYWNCTTDAQCQTHGLTTCNTTGGYCFECQTNNHCNFDIAAASCATRYGVCSGCFEDSECEGKFGSDIRYCTNQICSGCRTHEDCDRDSSAPACVKTPPAINFKCGGCREDKHCIKEYHPFCEIGSGYCRNCTLNTHCPNANNSYCDLYNGRKCAPCQSDTHCDRFGSRTKCKIGQRCVECLNGTHCSLAKSYCNPTTNECSICIDDSHCSLYPSTSRCKSGVGCFRCVTDDHCNYTHPVCTSSGQCTSCTAHTQCSSLYSEKPFCMSGQCKQCRSDSDCPFSTPICSSSLCRACIDNVDCSTSLWALPKCSLSTGACHNCLTFNDCLSPDAPVCTDGTPNTCTTCVADSDCAHLSLQRCTGTTCVRCMDPSDCDYSSPVCTGTYQCTGCTADAECALYAASGQTKCHNGVCTECRDDLECPSSNPLCNSVQAACKPCSNDIECQNSLWHLNKCDNGHCYECLTSNDCLSPSSSLCIGNVCGGCSTDAQCSHLAPLDKCLSGVCVQCLSHSDCSHTTPVCNSSNLCTGCTSDSDCSNYAAISRPHCFSSSCRQCQIDWDCPFTTPICNTESGLCEMCGSNEQCEASQWAVRKCDGGKCFECLTSNDCETPDKSYCHVTASNRTCEICNVNDDCLHLAPRSYCKENIGCVFCFDDTNCNHSFPICDTTYHQCTGCTTDIDCAPYASVKRTSCFSNQCKQCQGDIDCPFETPLCNTTTGLCVPCSDDLSCQNSFWRLNRCSGGSCYQCTMQADCTFPSYSYCNTTDSDNTCYTCSEDAECAHLGALLAKCNPEAGCAQCWSHSDCSDATPVCNASNQCTGCTTNSDCDLYASTNRTNCYSQKCKQCELASHCPFETPLCNTTSFLCRTCTSNNDCLSSTLKLPICTSSGTCIQCVSNLNCSLPNASQCAEQFCAACTDDSQCLHISGASYCQSGLCVGCRSDSDCEYQYKCSASTHKCYLDSCVTNSSKCPLGYPDYPLCRSDGYCVNCLDNSYCHDVTLAMCSPMGRCSPCEIHSHCLHLPVTPFCKEQTCVNCLVNTHCSLSNGIPACRNNKCTYCICHSECVDHGLGACYEFQCRECVINSHCRGQNQVCVNFTCQSQPCESNFACLSMSQGTNAICSDGSCYECLNNTQCSSRSKAVCDPLLFVCVPCSADIDCLLSFPNSQCIENVCVPNYGIFGIEPIQYISITVDKPLTLRVVSSEVFEPTFNDTIVTWQQNPSDPILIPNLNSYWNSKLNVFTLSIPAYTLTNRAIYNINIQAHRTSEPWRFQRESYVIRVMESEPVAWIFGGNRSVQADQELVLDASLSYHPDFLVNGNTTVPQYYDWICEDPCVDQNGQNLTLLLPSYKIDGGKYLVIPPMTLAVGTNYTFILVYYAGNQFSNHSVLIAPQATSANLTLTPKVLSTSFNRWEDIVLGYNINGSASSLTPSWSIPVEYFSNLDLVQIYFKQVASETQYFTVEVSSTDASTGTVSWAQLTLRLIDPPTVTCDAVPSAGIGFQTVYQLIASSTDDNLPLKYRSLFTLDPISNDSFYQVLVDYTYSPTMKFYLPYGNPDLNIKCEIKDSLGAIGEQIVTVEASRPSSGAADIQSTRAGVVALTNNYVSRDAEMLASLLNCYAQEIKAWSNTASRRRMLAVTGAGQCPNGCSGHGKCVIDTYNVTACTCDQGYASTSCSVTQDYYTQVISLKQEVMQNFTMELQAIANPSLQLNLAVSTYSALFGNPDLFEISMATSALFQLHNALVATRAANQTVDDNTLHEIAQIASNCLGKLSFKCNDTDPSYAENLDYTLTVLDQIRITALHNRLPNQEPLVIETDNFKLYVQNLEVQNFSNRTFEISNTSPLVQFPLSGVTVPGKDSTDNVDVMFVCWSRNFFDCSSNETNFFTFDVKEPKVPKTENFTVNDPVNLIYRPDSNVNSCRNGCNESSSTLIVGGFTCSCSDMNNFTSLVAVKGLYAKSNLKYLFNVKALTDFDFMSSLVFWIIIGSLGVAVLFSVLGAMLDYRDHRHLATDYYNRKRPFWKKLLLSFGV